MLLLTRRHFFYSLVPLDGFPLGVTTDEIDEDLVTAAKFLSEFHLRYAEVRSIWGRYNTAQPLDKIREAKGILDGYKVRTSVLSSAFFKIPLPPDTAVGRAVLDCQWAVLDAAMERAALLGTDKVRTFAFNLEKGQAADEKTLGRIWELVAEAARRAKVRHMRLAVENVGGSFVSTGAEAAMLLKAVPADNVGLTWDPNNAALSGERPPFPTGYSRLDPARIFHVHLRDFKGDQWCAVGEGEMDNLGQIRALLRDGYKEAFTLETHWRSPLGKMHATRTSLGGLLKVIEKV